MIKCEEGDITGVNNILDQHMQLIHSKDKKGYTPLSLVVKRGNLEITKLLLEKGADVNIGNNVILIIFYNPLQANQTPIFLAAWSGYKDIVDLLILYGANINA